MSRTQLILRINGENQTFSAIESSLRPTPLALPVTIEELIHCLNLTDHPLVIEHNGIALYRRAWATTRLQDGDQIELLHLSAGG